MKSLFLKAVYTDEFNHAPAQMFMHTGSPREPLSMGSWLTRPGIGENENLRVCGLVSQENRLPAVEKASLGKWFSAFHYQGVQFQSQEIP
ncbi:MAG: DUF1501 domain-containing protein [Bacteroidia bacterium]